MADSNILSPAILSTFQDVYLDKLVYALSNIGTYSLGLFYVIAGLEIAVFGLVWAIRQEELFAAFLFKILKLGLLFFLISNYPAILQAMINGFTQVAFQFSPSGSSQLIFNPALVWKYGFDHAIDMIKIAVQYGTSNTAMSSLFLILGFGNLLMFALIGVQIMVAVISFYLMSVIALLLIPFGAFVGTQSFLSRALQGVFKSGVRVFVVIFVIGIAASVWSALPSDEITLTTSFDKPLSFFLSALVVLVLIWKLPELGVQLVGELKGDIWGSVLPHAAFSSRTGGESSASSALASGAYLSPHAGSGLSSGIGGNASVGTSISSSSLGAVATAVAVQVANTGNTSSLFSSDSSKEQKEMKRSSEVKGEREQGLRMKNPVD